MEHADAHQHTTTAHDLESHRAELLLHCYRLLGSHRDAEDVVQEALTSAWRGLPTFEGRSSLRTWLHRIATNAALNARRSRSRRPVTVQLPFPAPVPTRRVATPWLEPLPDAVVTGGDAPVEDLTGREDVALAFVAALQGLPGRQAAALLLHDVVGFDRAEVAELLKTSPTAVKGLVQRARAAMPVDPADRTSAVSVVDPRLVERFVEALTGGDVGALVEVLTSDAVLAMPPLDLHYEGRSAIAAFLHASGGWLPDRTVEVWPMRCNGSPAFVHVIGGRGSDGSTGLVVLDAGSAGIRRITRFLDPGVVQRARAAVDAAPGR